MVANRQILIKKEKMNVKRIVKDKIVKSESKFSELIRFGLVGGLATIIQYVVYVLFVDYVDIPPVVATMVSYAISFVANFFLSNYFTFHTRPNAKKGIGFSLSHLINMGLQVGLVAIFKNFVDETWALLPAMAICIPINFFLVRFALTSKFVKSSTEKTNSTNK